MKLAVLGAALLVSACASGVPDLGQADVETTCVRWCESKHPSCAFTGAIIAPAAEPQRTCHRNFVACVRSCPPR